jgi:tRNA threonylcarbamoyladenosine biosynthesis protein TsaB
MIVLGIETSCSIGGVALVENQELLEEILFEEGMIHGRELVPSIERLLGKNNIPLSKIDLIAVDIGPGSYTGIRVGLATAKTLAYIQKIEIIGITSLDAMAENITSCEIKSCLPLIDAKWGQIYYAIYQRRPLLDFKAPPFTRFKGAAAPTAPTAPPETWHRISDYRVDSPLNILQNMPQGSFPFGDGLDRYSNVFGNKKTPQGVLYPRPQNIARLGERHYIEGQRDNLIKLLPLYLRPTEAEFKKAHIP